MTARWDEPKRLTLAIAWDPKAADSTNGYTPWFDCSYERPIPEPLVRALGRYLREGSLVIHYRIAGYYDPGRPYSTERYMPPEGDNEVILERVQTIPDSGMPERLPDEVARSVFDEYRTLIEELEQVQP